MLQMAKPGNRKKEKITEVSLNSIEPNATLKLIKFQIKELPVKALVDTGSSHCLINSAVFQKLPHLKFTPQKIHMKVAGGLLRDNVIGSTTITLTFTSDTGSVDVPLKFLVAHATNGYEAILGATMLLNPSVVSALTPNSLCLTTGYQSSTIALLDAVNPVQVNFLQCNSTVVLPGVTTTVVAHLCPPMEVPESSGASFSGSSPGDLLQARSLNQQLEMIDCQLINADTVECSIQSKSSQPIIINSHELFASVQKSSSVSELNSAAPVRELDQINDSIDEQIIAEHQLIDPSDLDKKFSYLDCEINPQLSPDVRKRLDKIILDNQSVFAKTKLDVGKFRGFTVQLDIDEDIPAEKQRFMAEEKMVYCQRTFEEFEKLGLVQECHSPKTISNLLLVPKYEGLRDLTKASVYLAQVKGQKNSSFRIVQDLRRINAKTRNIKRALPKLPEFIFQKLQNKVVSSVDCNMAYWHLLLDPESRSYTSFYLKDRTLQFCRMPQGLASAPACWDEAMKLIFSTETLLKIKAQLPPEEANQLPDTFEEFFFYYQDDSWIFSDNQEIHLLHVKAVLMAYKMHDIKLSPNKSTFFPESFKILGVTISPQASELALDQIKAKSILEWEKPDSLYTLQSRLYALNYWVKFIPSLAELKFPLQQIVRSQIFSWNEEADLAWERIKSIIALDIRLTIPERHEQLVLTTDASKIACSCILWVHRNGSLRVVGCYSKLFSHTDSLKSIHFKETYAMVLAFDHFKPYLLNTQKSIIVFTDARALLWVGRNREYSIACNGLVNKLAKIQLEYPHVVYSVPSEVNFLADLFSRAFTSSRFLDKTHFSLSKAQANHLPPLTEPFLATEDALYQFFSSPLSSESSDSYPRRKPKVSTPRPISSLYKMFQSCTPEEKYLSAIRLLKGWDDPDLRNKSSPELNSSEALYDLTEEEISSLERSVLNSFQLTEPIRHEQYLEDAVEDTMHRLYSDLDPTEYRRMKATLLENWNKHHKKTSAKLRNDFMSKEAMLRSKEKIISPHRSDPESDDSVEIHYTLSHPGFHPPTLDPSSRSINIPAQKKEVIHPSEDITVDLGVELFIPKGHHAEMTPHPDAPAGATMYIHPTNAWYWSTTSIRVLIKNTGEEPLTIRPGMNLLRAFVIPNIVENQPQSSDLHHPKSEDDKVSSSLFSSAYVVQARQPAERIKLTRQRFSPLHLMIKKKRPQTVHVAEINTNLVLPSDPQDNWTILNEVRDMDSHMRNVLYFNHAVPLSSNLPDAKTIIQQHARESVERRESALNSTVIPPDTPPEEVDILKQDLYRDMCTKLAMIAIDLIKNKSVTPTVLAKAQQADDYLSVIRESKSTDVDLFPSFVMMKQVLLKRIYCTKIWSNRFVLCLPDILLPSVIHTLHVTLGHPSKSAMFNNFKHFYYHRNAARLIKSYCESCVTCALATKHDIRKVLPSTERSLQPTRPRQYIYCDLIPMYQGALSCILFCLDAYSQYICAIPLKDKTSVSVLQGLISVFSTTGWPEAIYLDNETSFQKASKILVKMAPVKVLFSTPYCQFQNCSENYIKNFKKTFLKTLNDSENPQASEDWPVLLPTVTQAMNRQIIPALGLSREAIHFNLVSELHPLARLSEETADHLNQAVLPESTNVYQTVLQNRKKLRATCRKAQPQKFHETQLVFMKDQAPATSTILKIPNKGPYRIEKLEDRNVVLNELATGKEINSHVQNIRPLGLDEFKLILNKDWDLNTTQQKAARASSKPGIFDEPDTRLPISQVVKTEAEQEAQVDESQPIRDLFKEPSAQEPPAPKLEPKPPDPLSVPVQPPAEQEQAQQKTEQIIVQPTAAPGPAAPIPAPRRSPRLRARLNSISCDSDSESNLDSEGLTCTSFNSLHVHSDINQKSARKLRLKPRKNISFFLTNLPPYRYPPEEDTFGSDEDDIDIA